MSSRFALPSRDADGDWLDWRETVDGAEPALRTTVSVEQPRTIIARNNSPDMPFDRSINAYRGCEQPHTVAQTHYRWKADPNSAHIWPTGLQGDTLFRHIEATKSDVVISVIYIEYACGRGIKNVASVLELFKPGLAQIYFYRVAMNVSGSVAGKPVATFPLTQRCNAFERFQSALDLINDGWRWFVRYRFALITA